MDAALYSDWRDHFLAQLDAPDPGQKPAKKAPKKAARKFSVPEDLFEALHADTGDIQAAGWNLPPGATALNYTRSADAFAPSFRRTRVGSGHLPTVARYKIVSSVAPRITRAVSVADRVHKALCLLVEDHPESAGVFTGKGVSKEPLPGHQHARIFCEANGGRDVITHITVTAAGGFNDEARVALRRLNKVWGHGGHAVRLVLIGIGEPATFTDCRLFSSSRVWRSLTPFVSTRHTKTFRDGRPKIDEENGWQTGSAAHDLLRLLRLDPALEGAQIHLEKVITVSAKRTLRSLQYQTRRPNGDGGSRGDDIGSFVISLPEAFTGPLALGYGSHFGLGLFTPDERSHL